MTVALEQIIREYLLAHGYELEREGPYGGMWTRPGVAGVCSLDWAIKHCLENERDNWFGELEQFLAEF